MESDERYGAALLRQLAREPHTPSTVDVARAVADGERRQRMVRLASCGAAALVVVLVLVGGWAFTWSPDRSGPIGTVSGAPSRTVAAPSPDPNAPTPPTKCTLQRLGVPAGQPPKSVVTGADPTGRYIVGRSYPGNSRVPRVLIWDNREVRTVAMTGSDQQLHDITSTGVAVGTSYLGTTTAKTAAWMYKNGKINRLAGGVAEANAINEREVIVGSVNGKPAMWLSPTSQPTMLAIPGAGWSGYAADIDEDGTVVGRLNSAADKPDLGYLWRPDGSLHKLTVPTMRGAPATTYTADSIRDGWVIGWAGLDDGDVRYIGAPRWNLRIGDVETASFAGVAESVNRHGWMVGQSDKHGLLVAGRDTVRLPDLDGTQGRTIPYTISDDGTTIAGQVALNSGEPVAVVWNCR